MCLDGDGVVRGMRRLWLVLAIVVSAPTLAPGVAGAGERLPIAEIRGDVRDRVRTGKVLYPAYLPPSVRGTVAWLEFPLRGHYRVLASGRPDRHGYSTGLAFGSRPDGLRSLQAFCARAFSRWHRFRYEGRGIVACFRNTSRIYYARRSGKTYYAIIKYYGRVTHPQVLRMLARLERIR